MKRTRKNLALLVATAVTFSSLLFSGTYSAKAEGQSKDSKDIRINGNWEKQYEVVRDSDECKLMVRVGDIDNFGYGWGNNSSSGQQYYIDPFTGQKTPVHPYPFRPSSKDPAGTDRVMVVSGYHGDSKTDGYTSSTWGKGYNTAIAPVTLQYDLQGLVVENATIKMFVDDIQPSKWVKNQKDELTKINTGRGGFSKDSYNQYKVYFTIKDGDRTIKREVPELEGIINNLDQHGPIGNLITFDVPVDAEKGYLDMLQKGGSGFEILIDDPRRTVKDVDGKEINNTGDGFAIDFVKLMINKDDDYTVYDGTIQGKVYEASYVNNVLTLDKSKPVSGVKLAMSGVSDPIYTDASGAYKCDRVPAGQVIIHAEKDGYAKSSTTVDALIAKQTVTKDIGLIKVAKPLQPEITLSTTRPTNQNITATIRYIGNYTNPKYRINGGSWLDYTGPVTITDNCLIEAQSTNRVQINQSGATEERVSDTASLQVTNIDRVAPTGTVGVKIDGLTATLTLTLDEPNCTVKDPAGTIVSPNDLTNTNDILTVTDHKIYLEGKEIGTITPDNKVVVTRIGLEYTFEFEDEAGNPGRASNTASIPRYDR